VTVEVEEELVELGRRHGGRREHAVDLAAVVDLVLEEMGEQVVDALGRAAGVAAVGDDAIVESRGVEAVAEGDQPG
jgi:hypothetical protein